MKEALLKRLSPERRTALSARRAGVEAGAVAVAARVVAAPLKVLPRRLQGRIKQDFQPTVRLDYAADELRLAVDSEIELTTRAISCRKEPETIEWIEASIRPGDVVFDIGANVGAYSLIMDRVAGGSSTIYAFEPVFSNFAQLNKNVFLNGCQGRVVPMNLALSDRTAMIPLTYSSLTPGTALHGLEEAGLLVQPVLAARIDDLGPLFGVPAPNHLKLDVDGIEFSILQGADATFAAGTIRTVLVELEASRRGASAIEPWLRARGLELSSTHPHGPDGPTNAVFTRLPS